MMRKKDRIRTNGRVENWKDGGMEREDGRVEGWMKVESVLKGKL